MREIIAVHAFGPGESVLAHKRRTAGLGSQADAFAGRNGRWVVLYANRSVNGAEEETHVDRALNLDQRPKLVHLETSLVLCFMVQRVWHRRPIVADATTHGDCHLLTTFVFLLLLNDAAARATNTTTTTVAAAAGRFTIDGRITAPVHRHHQHYHQRQP